MFKNRFSKLALMIYAALIIFVFNNSIIGKINTASSDALKVKNFTLEDYNGKSHSLNDYKDSKAIVLMFIATQCPVSNAYNSRMAELYKNYKDKNIAFVGLNSNKAEGVNEIKSHAKKNNLNFVILKDDQNKIADELQASVTPEIYVLNSNFEVQYHGRIDDSRDAGEVENKDLENAINQILDGKQVSNKRTKAFGCSIKRVNN